MPESGVTKHNYFLCQFINPARGHEGERCDCYDTPSQKRTTLAKQRLLHLQANRSVNRASTSGTTESAVASDPVVTVTDLPISHNADSMFIVVDRFSKAIVITPCLKAITAKETSQLYLHNVWRRTGLPRTVISDRGPQFASKVMRETWSKLNVDQALSTAFHPQTDGETERVNQEF